jgi:hypothetical protein
LQAANAAAQQQAHRGVDDILRITKSMDQMSLLPSSSSVNGHTTVNGSSSSQQHHRLTSGSSIAGAVHVSEEDDSESDSDADTAAAADTADTAAGDGSSEQADEVSCATHVQVSTSEVCDLKMFFA